MIIVITKAQQPSMNQWMKDNVDPAGGEYTFTVPLYTGNTHTHYWCSINLTPEQRAEVEAKFGYTYDMKPNEVLELRNLNTGPEGDI